MILNENSICYFHCGGVLLKDKCFRLPAIKVMFSSIDWSIAVLVVVAELESNTHERYS